MPSALFPVAVGPTIATRRGTAPTIATSRGTAPTIATWRGTSEGARRGTGAHQGERDQRSEHDEEPEQLRPGRQRHGAPGFSLKKKVTVKNAFSSGYSGGSGTVGFEVRMALRAESVKASTGEGLATVTSVIRPSLCTLNVTTTCPRIVIAAIGMNQLRRTCATKRAIHGPNSTPLESKLMNGPNS